MKKLLGILAIVAFASTAQAKKNIPQVFKNYQGPSFSYCEVTADGTNVHLAWLLGGADLEGTVTCKNTNGKTYSESIWIVVGGLEASLLPIGVCPMSMDMDLLSAELNIPITPEWLGWFLGVVKVASVTNPVKFVKDGSNQHLSAVVGADIKRLGGFAGVGTMDFGKGCTNFANLWIGGVFTNDEYEDYKAKQKERMSNDK